MTKIKNKIIIIILIIIIIILFFIIFINYTKPKFYSRPIDLLSHSLYISENNLGEIIFLQDIKISSRAEPFISTESITFHLNLEEHQVQFLLNDFDDYFKKVNNYTLKSMNYNSKIFSFGILCDENHDKLKESIKKYPEIIDYQESEFKEPDKTSCFIFPIDNIYN